MLFVLKKTLSEKTHSARHQAAGVKPSSEKSWRAILAHQTDDGVVRWTRFSSRCISRVFPSSPKEVSHRSGVDDRPSQSACCMRSYHGAPAAVKNVCPHRNLPSLLRAKLLWYVLPHAGTRPCSALTYIPSNNLIATPSITYICKYRCHLSI